ncbi:NAD-dependent epimerase/dehydratase family protein [Sagittula sp. S175]|uniref:NAD-dependent epimerase/dehydratase family protein n=1 Tax=Sagittula sp. S175 TaxID=3415129 RepID=UPI003C7B2143
MADSDGVLLLGASGRLGRMVRAAWTGPALFPVYRDDIKRIQAEEDLPGLGKIGQIRTVAALWGSPDRPQEHATLAVMALHLARFLGAQRVIHCSSAAVYAAGNDDHRESDPLSVRSSYASGKVDMERAIRDWTHDNPEGPKSVVLRIGNVAGADSLFANLRPGQSITLDRFSDGRGPCRSYLTGKGFTEVVVAILADRQIVGTYNVAAHDPLEMADIALEAGAQVYWRDAPETAVQRVGLDVSKLLMALPEIDLSEDVKGLVKEARIGGIWP